MFFSSLNVLVYVPHKDFIIFYIKHSRLRELLIQRLRRLIQ